MIVLGSGGHTAEMLRFTKLLPLESYEPRIYVVADSDRMSAAKLDARATVVTIRRSRHVGQSYVTSIVTTLLALRDAMRIMRRTKPSLLLVNGPGTCIPIVVATRLLRLSTRIVYVESIARVKSLSLSAKILYWFRMADAIYVQWPELARQWPRTIHHGRIM